MSEHSQPYNLLDWQWVLTLPPLSSEDSQKVAESHPHLVVFETELPFELPLPEGPGTVSYRVADESRAFVCLFEQRELEIESTPYGDMPPPKHLKSRRTRVRFGLAQTKEFDFGISEKEVESTLSYAFDTAFRELQGIIRSYIVATKDVQVYQVTQYILYPICAYVLANAATGEETPGIFMLNENLSTPRNPISYETFSTILYNRDGNAPFFLATELKVASYRYLNEGNTRLTVIMAQSSFEVFLAHLLRLFMGQEGRKETEIEDALEKPFLSRVKREYHPRIGGTFNIDRSGKIKDWYCKSYTLRNRVIHVGYQPSIKEARDCFWSVEDAISYVIDRLDTIPQYKVLANMLRPQQG